MKKIKEGDRVQHDVVVTDVEPEPQFKIGDRVKHVNDAIDVGTVVQTPGCKVRWDSGNLLTHHPMYLRKVPPKPKKKYRVKRGNDRLELWLDGGITSSLYSVISMAYPDAVQVAINSWAANQGIDADAAMAMAAEPTEIASRRVAGHLVSTQVPCLVEATRYADGWEAITGLTIVIRNRQHLFTASLPEAVAKEVFPDIQGPYRKAQ